MRRTNQGMKPTSQSASSNPSGILNFRRTVWPLAVAETLLWASIYYVFHALLPRWEADFGWTKTQIAGAFTAALLCSAVSAPVIGGLIDRGLGRFVMGVGGFAAAILLMCLSTVHALWQFVVVWILLGICHSAVLYEPCFAILTQLFKNSAKRAITVVTLVAGFAGTLSFPLAHLLSEAVDWRFALRVFALISVVATLLALYALKNTLADKGRTLNRENNASGDIRLVIKQPMFWLIAAGFTMIALNHGALLPHLLPLLHERGISTTTAVLTASMIGPMQVFGRLCMVVVEQRVSITTITLGSFFVVTVAALALLLSKANPLLLVVFVICQGAGYGVTSITRPAITARLLGHQGFGAISGTIAIPFITAFALGPTLAATLWTWHNYDAVIWMIIVAAIFGLIFLFIATRLPLDKQAR